MRLVDNWQGILWRSYTMWLVYLAGLLELAPYVVPYAEDYIPRWMSIALMAASPLARVIQQRAISDRKDEDEDDAR